MIKPFRKKRKSLTPIVESHTSPNAFSCTQCDYRTKNSKLLERHVISQHESRISPLCDQCNCKTRYGNSMIRHKEKVHSPTYPCEYCTFGANLKNVLNPHIRQRHGIKRHGCDQCQYAAKAPRPLEEHKKVVHKGILYSCFDCEHRTKKPGSVRNHMCLPTTTNLILSNYKTLENQCILCWKGFSSSEEV